MWQKVEMPLGVFGNQAGHLETEFELSIFS